MNQSDWKHIVIMRTKEDKVQIFFNLFILHLDAQSKMELARKILMKQTIATSAFFDIEWSYHL